MNRIMKQSKRKQQMLMALGLLGTTAIGAASQGLIQTADAETTNQTAGGFDLTKQASSAPFPVMFDRPSGVNAAALAGSLRTLGSNSDLYKSALKVIPELADGSKMSTLLNNSLSDDASVASSARSTILKLINWYNSLGGFQIKTQSGAPYTATNLDEPINTIAVGFADAGSNKLVSDQIQQKFGSVSNVGDVMSVLDSYKAGTSTGYVNAFNAYKTKVNAPGANISALSELSEVQPLLNAYEKMYADGATAIRTGLLNQNGVKEAAVAFFESAIITGRVDNSNGGTSNQNNVPNKKVTTRWVSTDGSSLAPDETGDNYKDEKTFSGYVIRESRTDNGIKTYIYEKVSEKTQWVDESGKPLLPEKSGTFPDKEGDDVPGYTLIKTETKKDGANTTTVNTYKKTPDNKPAEQPKPRKADTYWFDVNGNELKPVAKEQTLPDNDGVSDIPGYKLVRAYQVTQASLDGDLKGSKFQIGDTINIYEKVEEPKPKPDTPKTEKITTKWVDEHGNKLKDPQDGAHPDVEGDDVPGYKILRTIKDEKGNITNVYEKIPAKKVTNWVDKDGNKLKDTQEGEFPDKEGDDVPGYRLVKTDIDKDGNVTNVYEKVVTTTWVDKNGNKLKDPKEGEFPDKEGDDVPGYRLVHVSKDKDGNVTNVYEKIEAKKITTWVDEEGNKLQDPKEGEFPDKEGDDIPGYTFVKTNVKDNGDIENVYKKNQVKKVTTHWVDKNGKRLSEDETGEDFGKEKTIDGYKLVDVRTSKDGTEKFYIYEPVKADTHKQLPQTGDTAGGLAGLIGTMMVGLGGLTLRRKKNVD